VRDVGDFAVVAQEEIRQDLRAMLRGAIRAGLELVLAEELERLVGADWYGRVAGRRDRRNGAYVRRLLASLGAIELTVPRTRGSGSVNAVVGRYRRRTAEVDALLTSAYVNGVSARKAGDLTTALLGERVSRSTVSRVAKGLDAQVAALQRAPITGAHPYLYLDATFLHARWARSVENVSALVAYAVGSDGHRRLLGVSLGAEESEASWATLLAQLIERGLAGVRLVIADEHAGLAAAVRRFLPEAERQRCTVHLQRNVLSRVPARLRPRVAREVAALFHAKSLPVARQRLAELPGPLGPGAPRGDGVSAGRLRRGHGLLPIPVGALEEDPDDEWARAAAWGDQAAHSRRGGVSRSRERAPADHGGGAEGGDDLGRPAVRGRLAPGAGGRSGGGR